MTITVDYSTPPTPGSLALGEIVVNPTLGQLFFQRTDNSINQLATVVDGKIASEYVPIPALGIGVTRAAIATTKIIVQSFVASGYTIQNDMGRGAPYIRGVSTGPGAIQDANGTWWNIDVRAGASVCWFGAIGDNTTYNLVAINATLAAVHSVGGGIVTIPVGKYVIEDQVTVPLNAKIMIIGAGVSATIIRQINAGANGIVFIRDNYLTTGGGVFDLTIEAGAGFECAGYFGKGSDGVALLVERANDAFSTGNLGINNFAHSIDLNGCWNTSHYNLKILFTETGVRFQKSNTIDPYSGTHVIGGGNKVLNAKISNFGYTSNNVYTVGLLLTASGGEMLTNIDITELYRGVQITPDATSWVLYLNAIAVNADTSVEHGWYIDGSLGAVQSLSMANCWSSYNAGAGFVTYGSKLSNIKWVGGSIRENKMHGIGHGGGRGLVFSGVQISDNSRTQPGLYSGVFIAPGCGDIAVIGCTGQQDVGVPSQLYWADINNGGDNISIIGCMMTNGYRTAAIRNVNTSGSNIVIEANTPKLANMPALGTMAGGSVSPIGPGETKYLGPNGVMPWSQDAPWMVPRRAKVTRMYIASMSAPGSGRSYHFTVVDNGVDTGMTGTISNGDYAVDIWGAVDIGEAHTLEIKVVTDAGTPWTKFRYFLVAV